MRGDCFYTAVFNNQQNMKNQHGQNRKYFGAVHKLRHTTRGGSIEIVVKYDLYGWKGLLYDLIKVKSTFGVLEEVKFWPN